MESPDEASLSDQVAKMRAYMDHIQKILEGHLVEAEERITQLETIATDWETKAQERQQVVIILKMAVEAGATARMRFIGSSRSQILRSSRKAGMQWL